MRPYQPKRIASAGLGLVPALAVLLAASPAAAAIVRQPYLQHTSTTSVTIVWRTDLASPSDSRVRYGTTLGVPDQSATSTAVVPPSSTPSDEPNVKDHVVLVTDLTPGMKYFYDVGSTSGGVEAGGSAEHYFVMPPAVGTATPFTAWIVGDSGNASANQANVRDAMLAHTAGSPPDLFVHVGDIAYNDGRNTEFTANHFAPYANILRHTPFLPTIGNHDAIVSGFDAGTESGPYFDAFVLQPETTGVLSGTESYYSFDYANVHFVVLNSEDANATRRAQMLSWLAADLAATDQDWIVASFHHPTYSKGTHDSDSSSDSGGRMVWMRENALPVLEAGGVDLVLAGHSHTYERSYLIDGVYGFGSSPNFATPSFATLSNGGYVLDDGDGDIAGDGAYVKAPAPNDGAVYLVTGHGGQSVGCGGCNHPVMHFSEGQFGSSLLSVAGNGLTVTNVRANGTVTDTFSIVKADWVAYDDLNDGVGIAGGSMPDNPANGDGNAPNVTGHDYYATDAALLDFLTGDPLSVTMTGLTGTDIDGDRTGCADANADCYDPQNNDSTASGVVDPGTDADLAFDGNLDFQGVYELDAASWKNVIRFDGLDPGKRYSIALTTNRNEPDYANARFTRVTIVGADTFTNASTPGVVVNGPDSVSFSTGYNPENGHVARWTDISAADGSFAIVSEWDDTLGGSGCADSTGACNTKGYAMSVFELMQFSPPTPISCEDTEDCDDGNLCTVDTCVSESCDFAAVVCDLGEVCDPGTGLCEAAPDAVSEDFENGFSLGETIGAHPDWFDGGAGPVVTSGIGVAGSVGLAPGNDIFTWTAQPFDWNAPDFVAVEISMDFQTDGSGLYDDDRLGFMITDTSANSDNIFGVQLDPGGSGQNIEGYWDGVGGGGDDRRPSMANLPGLAPNAFQRFFVRITKLRDASHPSGPAARVEASLTALDGSGNPGAVLASGTIADTSALGADAPDAKYFTGPIWPAMKNFNATSGAADNAYVRIVTTAPPEPCTDDLDCTDGLFCNGTETCDTGSGTCLAGTPACTAPAQCSEAGDVCLSPGDVIIAGFQAWNDATDPPTPQSPGEFVELFNTTAQTISLAGMNLTSRVDVDAGDGSVDVDWDLVADEAPDLSGLSIAPHSFVLVGEAGVIGSGGIVDVPVNLDLATGEGGVAERAISLELSIDGVHMDYVLYGRHDGSTPAGELPPGDLPFGSFGFGIPLVDAGASWRYLDDGSDQGSAWRAPAFDDGSWASGPAPLGYGGNGETTVVDFGPDPNNKYITTYFRHSFEVVGAAGVTGLTLDLVRDDGAVVYLNGTEVARDNMPGGAITAATLAPAAVGGADETTFFSFVVDPGLLVEGTNVLAVEIHQNAGTSSDLGFDLALTMPAVRSEVIRNTLGSASFEEGVVRRLGPDALHAGHDVEGTYADEGALGSGLPPGVWTSPHDNGFSDYVARSSAEAPVPAFCTSDAECSDGSLCTGIETCHLPSGTCEPGTPVVCSGGEVCDPGTGLCEAAPVAVSFQEGSDGYAGTLDSFLQEASPGNVNGALAAFEWDGDDPSGGAAERNLGLLRFENVFGSGPGQIPQHAQVQSAILTLQAFDAGNDGELHEMLVDWDEGSDLGEVCGAGPCDAGDEFAPASLATIAGSPTGVRQVDVTASFAAWATNPAQNRGWIFVPTGTDGVELRSSEYGTLAERPLLSVVYLPPPPCTTDPECDDGVACTADTCAAGVCSNSIDCAPGEVCDLGGAGVCQFFPRVEDGQIALYTFDEGSGTNVQDVSGVGTPLDLTVQDSGAVAWSATGLQVTTPTQIASGGPATKLTTSIQASAEATIEAWVTPANTTQFGPARIVALSQNAAPNGGNFMLGQGSTSATSSSYAMRFRTSSTDVFGNPAFNTATGSLTTSPTHVVFTRAAGGQVQLYLDAVSVVSGTRAGALSNWNAAYPLVLANEPSGDRPWLGTLHLVAVYDRALTPAEVAQNFEAGPNASGPIPAADADMDGVPDASDNCTLVANADQRDTNGDGFGNLCDADVNDDGLVGVPDALAIIQAFGSTPIDAHWNEHADFNGDDVVGIPDYLLLIGAFGLPPGPAAP